MRTSPPMKTLGPMHSPSPTEAVGEMMAVSCRPAGGRGIGGRRSARSGRRRGSSAAGGRGGGRSAAAALVHRVELRDHVIGDVSLVVVVDDVASVQDRAHLLDANLRQVLGQVGTLVGDDQINPLLLR